MVARTRSCAAARQAGHVSEDAESYAADYSTLDLKVGSLEDIG